MKLKDILNGNIVNKLDQEKLDAIGLEVSDWFEEDSKSREDWERKYEKWIKLASQTMEEKNFPWRKAANIKYPLLTNAAMQFNARVVPALTPNMEPVGIQVIGDDPEGQRRMVAQQVSKHMNYQLMEEIKEWEEDFDKLTLVLSITGQEYKKTYYSYDKGRICSEFVPSSDLVIHYWYNEFENTRKTHKIPMTYNELLERMNMGIYKEYTEEELGEPVADSRQEDRLRFDSDTRHGYNPTKRDEATPHLILDHHGWYDLDEDGYAEPYRIVVHRQSKKVLEISPRFTEEDIMLDEDEDVIKIEPIEYFTKYGLIPNPDGSNYDIGFGVLLTPINEVVNTTTNQLLDAGTLANMQAGFIGKGIRLKGGNYSVQPGKWTIVNSTGGALKDNIVPLPIKEPNEVLLKLMLFMVEAGKELSATTDIFSGQMPGQNTKAGVAATVREEGLKIFNATYKRIRRAMKSEMQKIFKLNYLQLSAGIDNQTTRNAQKFGVTSEHYDSETLGIQPSADPSVALKEQRVQKDMGVLQLISTYGGNVQAALARVLMSLETDGIEELMQAPEPQPDPEVILDKAEIERKIQKDKDDADSKRADQVLKLLELQLKAKDSEDQGAMNIAKALADFMKIGVDREKNERAATNKS